MSSVFFEWMQSRLHAECDTVIAFYDQDRRLLAQAQVASAAAHHAAEVELAAARETIARLEGEVSGERARADQAEAALETVRRTVADPPDLSRPRLGWLDEPSTELVNMVLIRICLRNEADQYAADSDYGEHMHHLADLYQARVRAVQEATKTAIDAPMAVRA